MDLRDYLKLQHSVPHVIIDQQILPPLSDDQLRARPGGEGNSVAWLLWHATRCEDVAINAIVRGAPQVLQRGGFAERGALADSRIGTGISDDEVGGFGDAVDLGVLRAYRHAVRDDTAGWLGEFDLALLDQRPDLEERIATAGALWDASGAWVREMWQPWPNSVFVNWVAIGHTLMHIGEMQSVMARLGIAGR